MAHRLNDASSALNDLIKKSIKLSNGPPERYCLLTTRSNLDMDGEIRRWTFGQKRANMQNKTILLVGETGTGKTTLINTMVNYYLGVKFEDKVWFEISEEDQQDQTESKTSVITAYEIISEEKPFFLTIIDTPGYRDTRGIDQDMKIPRNLLKLFLHETGVKDLDAVCLVLKASGNRISDAQRYIFEGVLSLFGKDIEDIIVLFITYSDGGAPTDVLQAVKKEKIPCCNDNKNTPVNFLFNNRQSEIMEKEYEHVSRSWGMGERSLEKFFKFLESRERKSVGLTVSVLNERTQLKACIQKLKERIKDREEEEKELTQIQETLKKNKEKIEKDENVPFTVTTVYKEKVDVTGASWWDRKVTSCETCEENCHEFGCWISLSAKWCYVMRGDHCTVCKCHHSKHVRESRKYITKKKEEIVTFKELKNKYSNENEGSVSYDKNAFRYVAEELDKTLKRKEGTMDLETILDNLLDKNKNKKKRLVKEACEAIIKLSEIALKSDSAFTLQHLGFLIHELEEAEEAEWAQKLKRIWTDAAKESTKSAVEYLGRMTSKTELQDNHDRGEAKGHSKTGQRSSIQSTK